MTPATVNGWLFTLIVLPTTAGSLANSLLHSASLMMASYAEAGVAPSSRLWLNP